MSGVDMVMVNGEVVLSKGKFTRIDKEAILAELADSLNVPLTSEEERRRELSKEVFPYVKGFYDGWLNHSGCNPFYCQNAHH
jgi:hypothetical protein